MKRSVRLVRCQLRKALVPQRPISAATGPKKAASMEEAIIHSPAIATRA
ncbi:hypothetical protein SMICM304S_02946 [Streptomyces microflavus]